MPPSLDRKLELIRSIYRDTSSMQFDVVVIGAGSAGCVMAARLSEDRGRTVALIEAGADYPGFREIPDAVKYVDSRHAGLLEQAAERQGIDWGFTGIPAPSRKALKLPRGKIMGGTGSINGHVFLRGLPVDFEEWAAAGNAEWSFAKVLPYFRKLETDLDYHSDYHGSAGPMRISRLLRHDWSPEDHAFEEACVGMGFSTCDDLNAPDPAQVGPTPSSSQDGTRLSTARAYLGMARARPNLTIIPNTHIHRLVFDGARVRGAQTMTGEVIEAREVIVSAGVLKSPHLLMLSGIGPADHLREFGITPLVNLPGVGQNLRDHPKVIAKWRPRGDAPARRAARQQLGFQGSAGMRVRVTAEGSTVVDDCIIRSFGSAAMEGDAGRVSGTIMTIGLSQQTSTGIVRLQSADPAQLPAVDLRFLATQSDRSRLGYALRVAMELAEQPAIRKFLDAMLEPGPGDLASGAALEAWLLRRVNTGHHLTSTCAMGPDSDKQAVVDQYGRVRGVEGVRVSDASIMPKCTRPNTNATTIMIGERIADFVKEQTR